MFETPVLEFFIFQFLIFAFLGALLGSFASAIIHRVEAGTSWIFAEKNKTAARSQCPKCHHQLKVIDLIPLFSWLLLRGRCRYCQGKISSFYVALEVLSIVVASVIFIAVGFSIIGFLLLAIWPFILSQVAVYYRTGIISQQLCVIIGGGLIATALLFI